MNPWRLIAILEKSDPSFQDLFYPSGLRCHMDERIVLAIEQHWPAYFPTKKECRGPSWSLSIPENKPLNKPRVGSVQELNAWKKRSRTQLLRGELTVPMFHGNGSLRSVKNPSAFALS